MNRNRHAQAEEISFGPQMSCRNLASTFSAASPSVAGMIAILFFSANFGSLEMSSFIFSEFSLPLFGYHTCW
jgi:hypothetical protein